MVISMSTNWSQEKYIKSFRFAAEKHNNQIYPGTDWPYIVHLSIVCMEGIAALAHEPDLDGDLSVQCALLHDTLEDTEVTYADLKTQFGEQVANGVQALTKNSELEGKLARMADSLARIRKQPKEIWMVKMADRITNLQPPPVYWTYEKRIRYLEEAKEIHSSLKDASPYLSARLSEKMEAYKKYISL
jgi:(p)ppGpp synthase/HD superfamily hydrolase